LHIMGAPSDTIIPEVPEQKKVDMKVAKQLGFKAVAPDAPLVGGPVGVAPVFAQGKTGEKFKQEDLAARLQRLKGFAQDSKDGPGVVAESAFEALMVEEEECVATLPIVSVEGLPNMPMGKCVGSGSLKLTKLKSSHRVHIHITTSDNQMSATESVATSCCFGVKIFARYTASQDITSHAFVTNVEQSVHHSHYSVKNMAQSVRQLQNPEGPKSDDSCAFKCCELKGCCGGCCGGSVWSNSASYTSAMELQAAAAKLEAGQTSVQAKFPEVQEMTLEQKHARAMTVQQELTMVLRQSANSSSRCVVTFDGHTKAEDIMRFSSLLSSLASPGPEAPSARKWIPTSPSLDVGGSCTTCGCCGWWSSRTPKQKMLIALFIIVILLILFVPWRSIGDGGSDYDDYDDYDDTVYTSSTTYHYYSSTTYPGY